MITQTRRPPATADALWLLPDRLRAQIDRLTAEWAAREQLIAAGLAPRTHILLYGPPDCGQQRVVNHLAQTVGVPITAVSLALWRVTTPRARLQALDAWCTAPLVMFRPDPWWTLSPEELQRDPWMVALIEWIHDRAPTQWVIVRALDRPRWTAVRAACDDTLAVWPPSPAAVSAFVHHHLPTLPPETLERLGQILPNASFGEWAAVCAAVRKAILLRPDLPLTTGWAQATQAVLDRRQDH
jgi:hypothetical protein